MAKAKRKGTIRVGNKTVNYFTNLFPESGHTTYSGFGCHDDKHRKAERRNRKLEERRARFYGED